MAQIDGAGQQDTDDQNAETLQAALAQRQVTLQGQPQSGSDVPLHQNSDPVSDESEILRSCQPLTGKRRVPWVSTADQSCERQERDLSAFAQRAGYEVVGTYKETASGVRVDRTERKRVLALVQRREIDAVLVTELSRWGRSTTDLLATLREMEARRVSLVALNGMAFDLTTPHGRMMVTVLAGIAEFERELTAERIRSGIAAAKARGKKLGRQPGQRPKSDRLAPKVLALVAKGRSYRLIGREVGLSKNTVAGIVKRTRAALVGS